jgi:hypothetical protein
MGVYDFDFKTGKLRWGAGWREPPSTCQSTPEKQLCLWGGAADGGRVSPPIFGDAGLSRSTWTGNPL